MTKHLIITRHTQAVAEGLSDVADHERALSAAGQGAALRLGAWMVDKGYRPDQVFVSDARRTRETWSGIRDGFPDLDVKAVFLSALYVADSEFIFDLLCKARGNVVMIVGHNPTVAHFADRFIAHEENRSFFPSFPPGATIVFDIMADCWANIDWGRARKVDYITP